jgi:hypothetical protein
MAIPARLMTADVTLAHRVPDAPDAYNQPTFTIRLETVKGYYLPRRSNTVVSSGEVEKSDESVMINPGPKVDDLDHVIVDGERFGVDGEAMNHWNPRSASIGYVRIDLRRGVN